MLDPQLAVYRKRNAAGDDKKAEQIEARIREIDNASKAAPTPPR